MNFSKKPKLAVSILCSPATFKCPLAFQAVNTAADLCWVASSVHSCHQSTSPWLGSAAASLLCFTSAAMLAALPKGKQEWAPGPAALRAVAEIPKWLVNDTLRTHLKSCTLLLLLTTHRFSPETEAGVAWPEGCSRVLCCPLFSIQFVWTCLFLHKGQSSHTWLPHDSQLCPVLQTQRFRLLVTVWSVITDIISVIFEQILIAQAHLDLSQPSVSAACWQRLGPCQFWLVLPTGLGSRAFSSAPTLPCTAGCLPALLWHKWQEQMPPAPSPQGLLTHHPSFNTLPKQIHSFLPETNTEVIYLPFNFG